MPGVALEAPADKPIIFIRSPGDKPMALSVQDIMEDGICGSEWGWITIGELADYGYGLDTDSEVWTTDNTEVVREQMVAYYATHKCLDEENEAASTCDLHEHGGAVYFPPEALEEAGLQ